MAVGAAMAAAVVTEAPVTEAAVLAVALTLGLSVVPAPVAGRTAATAEPEIASTPGVPVVAALAAEIIPAPKAEEPWGLEPPILQLLGGRD
jgi:hypothetical protein